MLYKKLREAVLEANLRLEKENLVRLTWGNVSAVNREKNCFAIKPSGVPYSELRAKDIVIVDLETGEVRDGRKKPSSDTPTHRILYNKLETLGGICHTHSPWATVFCQAGVPLQAAGTTHADHFGGAVPLIRALTKDEVNEDYEGNTGIVIAEHFTEPGLNPLEIPGVLQHFHAPFTWGKDANTAVDNAVALEMCCMMHHAAKALNLEMEPMPEHILKKHHDRKHGPAAYYGQK